MANCLSIILLTVLSLLSAKPISAARLNGSVDADGKALADVVITVMPISKPKPQLQSQTKPAVMELDQKGREFIPHVLVIKTGTAVYFPNSDDIQHHVYSFSSPKPFELKLYKGTPTRPIVFNKPGIIALGCNIHDWMLGFVYVTDSPYFTKTDVKGQWSIDLPDGDYRLSLWHPDAAVPEQLPTIVMHAPAQQTLHHSLALKARRQTGKPPNTLQLEGYEDGF